VTHHHDDSHHHESHVVGYGSFTFVWLGLLALTGVTVAIAGIDFGKWTIPAALFIATIKTGLVLNIFMHLKYEQRIFKVFVGVSAVTLLIFFVLTFFDYGFH